MSSLTSIDATRHPAALAAAIFAAWRPYRWRGYLFGLLGGLVVGGVAAPIVTTTLIFGLSLAGAAPAEGAVWPELLWMAAFALASPLIGATLVARWQPADLRSAAQTYLWLAMRAEENWATATGTRIVPRDERSIRAFLASTPETAANAGERVGLWIALLDLDRARSAMAGMPSETPADLWQRASAAWLADFLDGAAGSAELDALQPLADALEDPDIRRGALVDLAVNRARVALAEGQDWRAPLAAVRPQLGAAPDSAYDRWLWRPAFRRLLFCCVAGVIVYWIAGHCRASPGS